MFSLVITESLACFHLSPFHHLLCWHHLRFLFQIIFFIYIYLFWLNCKCPVSKIFFLYIIVVLMDCKFLQPSFKRKFLWAVHFFCSCTWMLDWLGMRFQVKIMLVLNFEDIASFSSSTWCCQWEIWCQFNSFGFVGIILFKTFLIL